MRGQTQIAELAVLLVGSAGIQLYLDGMGAKRVSQAIGCSCRCFCSELVAVFLACIFELIPARMSVSET